LITGVPHLEVEAEAPVFSGEIAGDADGGGRGSLPRAVFETFRVSEGAVTLRFPEQDLSLEFPAVDISWIRNRGSGRLAAGSVEWRGGTESVTQVVFAGAYGSSDWRWTRSESTSRPPGTSDVGAL
jgi:hypothetical protein